MENLVLGRERIRLDTSSTRLHAPGDFLTKNCHEITLVSRLVVKLPSLRPQIIGPPNTMENLVG